MLFLVSMSCSNSSLTVNMEIMIYFSNSLKILFVFRYVEKKRIADNINQITNVRRKLILTLSEEKASDNGLNEARRNIDTAKIGDINGTKIPTIVRAVACAQQA